MGLGRQSRLAKEVVARDIRRANADHEGDILCRHSCHVEEEEDVRHIGFALEDHSGRNSLFSTDWRYILTKIIRR